jgi:SAM-dependent methyltransferase
LSGSIHWNTHCGRGEWLELLRHNGFQAKGVDLDEGMLSACRELDLNVCQVDALEYLRGLKANKLIVISAFHIVEHISFEALRQWVDEAYRVLKPSGLLILETPNSENLVVGTSDFYLDPTHQRPLPAQLLSFVVEYAGFARVKTLYLQESPELVTAQRPSLFNVLGGVSPDYAIVAQKKATAKVFSIFDEPFDHSYGMRLDILAARYDQQAEIRAAQLEDRTAQLEVRATQAENRAI